MGPSKFSFHANYLDVLVGRRIAMANASEKMNAQSRSNQMYGHSCRGLELKVCGAADIRKMPNGLVGPALANLSRVMVRGQMAPANSPFDRMPIERQQDTIQHQNR
jgi:hypothetical protein